MEKYEERLFKEFLKTQKIEITKKNQDHLFKNWLYEKEKILPYYEEFLESMGMLPRRGVIEFDKSEIDSILPYIPYDSIGIAVSEYYKDKDFNRRKIVGVNGRVEIKNNDIILKYNNKERILDFINSYVTQIPIDFCLGDLLIDLVAENKNVFIGTYGNLKDNDIEIKLKDLYSIKEEIEAFTGKNIEGEVVKTSNYYLAAITPKLKYKKKELKIEVVI